MIVAVVLQAEGPREPIAAVELQAKGPKQPIAAVVLQAEGPRKPRAAARLQARGPKLIVVCPGAAGELPAFFANMWGRGSLPQARKAIWLRDRPNMMGSQPASDGGVVGPG